MLHEALPDAACPVDWYHPAAIKFYKGKGLKFWEEKK
jgi:hypothetical protein